MGLRDYQQAAVQAVIDHEARGTHELLLVLPTGTGKTRCISALPRALGLQPWQSVLFLVLSDELATQAANTFKSVNPEMSVTIEMGDRKCDPDSDVIVASIQTLSRPNRREKFDPSMFRLVNYDEAHHCLARESLAVLEHFRVLKGTANRDPGILLCGTTATPVRTDTRGLEKVFTKIVFNRTVRRMIDDGWICDIQAYRITTGSDIRHVATRQGEFAVGQLERAVNTPERNALLVKSYLQYGAGLPYLAFAADVQHATDITDTFRHHGIGCGLLTGKTPKGERRELVEAHRSGQLLGIASCSAISEGFDSPRATVGLMAAPRRSSLRYTQEVGRLFRRFPAPEDGPSPDGYCKQKAIILDFADEHGEHRIFNVATLFGLHADFDLKGASARRTVEAVEQIERQQPGLDLKAYPDLDALRAAAYAVDLFQPVAVPAVAKRFSRFAWLQRSDDTFRLALANGTSIYITENQLGQFEVLRQSNGNHDFENCFDTAEEAFAYADSMVPVEVIGAALANARWRKAPPSEKQAMLIWRLDKNLRQQFSSAELYFKHAKRMYYAKDKAFTKGAFSQRIEMLKFNRGAP